MARIRLSEVAARAGVTTGAASLALNGKLGVSTETRERVRLAARDLGYAPHQGARSLSQGSSGLWGAIFDGTPEIWRPWISGALAQATASGVRLMVQKMPPPERKLEAMRQILAEARLDGVLLLDPNGNDNQLKPLWDAKLPTVVAGRRSHWFDCLEIHDRLALNQILEQLSQGGKRPVALVATRSQIDREDPRIQVWSRYRGTTEPGVLIAVADDSPEAALAVADQIFPSTAPPSAILCLAGDRTAWGILREAQRRGISVPNSLAIAGWGDLETSAWIEPGLSTLQLPWEELGARSAGLLQTRLGALEAPKVHRTLDARLITRRSA